jgi:hypothetical protein
MFDYVRNGPPAETLGGSRLMGTAAFLLMACVPLRPISILRLDPSKERGSTVAGSIEVPTKDKSDARAAETMAVIRPCTDQRVCPLRYYYLVKRRANLLGVMDCLWCTNAGRPFVRSEPILRRLKGLMADTEQIPPEYGAYSIRHAAFTALMRKMSVEQVTEFSGHSRKTHTLEKFYLHLDQNHAGNILASLTAVAVAGTPLLDVDAGLAKELEEEDRRETEAEEAEDVLE